MTWESSVSDRAVCAREIAAMLRGMGHEEAAKAVDGFARAADMIAGSGLVPPRRCETAARQPGPVPPRVYAVNPDTGWGGP